MYFKSLQFTVISYLNFVLILIGGVKSDVLTDLLGTVSDITNNILKGTASILQGPVARDLCDAKTNELCEYYGYKSEVHTVTTDDGYILTLFRCNAKKTSINNKKVVVLHHGVLSSSDDYAMNMPSQGLAYIMADEGYDVWMPNYRGNVYSRRHTTKNANKPTSGFWNFSWDDIAYHDYPATFDYIRKSTNTSKLYIVAHSQGTSALLALLSKEPKYNDYMHAVSLMAPVSYLNHSALLYEVFGILQGPLEILENQEFLPRGGMSNLGGALCTGPGSLVCDSVMSLLFGPSDNKNKTMIPTYVCHTPSGSSTDQLLHFGQEIRHGYFGERMKGLEVPHDYPLHKITVPMSLHYSIVDTFTHPKDVGRLISQLNGTSDLHIQSINHTNFNHLDFVWGIQASDLIYPQILNFFKKHTRN